MQVHIVHLAFISPQLTEQVNVLWNENYPVVMKDRFTVLLQETSHHNHYFLFNENNKLLGWAMDFERDDDIWFSIIVDEKEKNKGYGKLLINALKENNPVLNGWVIDHDNYKLQNDKYYRSPLSFYQALGFTVDYDTKIETPDLIGIRVTWKRNNY